MYEIKIIKKNRVDASASKGTCTYPDNSLDPESHIAE